MVLPFPYGLGAALALFIAFPLILRRRMMNRMRGGYGGSGSGSGSGGGFGGLFGQISDNSSKFWSVILGSYAGKFKVNLFSILVTFNTSPDLILNAILSN